MKNHFILKNSIKLSCFFLSKIHLNLTTISEFIWKILCEITTSISTISPIIPYDKTPNHTQIPVLSHLHLGMLCVLIS